MATRASASGYANNFQEIRQPTRISTSRCGSGTSQHRGACRQVPLAAINCFARFARFAAVGWHHFCVPVLVLLVPLFLVLVGCVPHGISVVLRTAPASPFNAEHLVSCLAALSRPHQLYLCLYGLALQLYRSWRQIDWVSIIVLIIQSHRHQSRTADRADSTIELTRIKSKVSLVGQARVTSVSWGCAVVTGVCATVYYISQSSATEAVLPATLALITLCWKPSDEAAIVAQVTTSALFFPRMVGLMGDEMPVVPGCFVLPVIGTFSHLSLIKHLTVCLWLNACVFRVSHNWKEWLVSALITIQTSLAVLLKIRWLQQPHTAGWSGSAHMLIRALVLLQMSAVGTGIILEGPVMLGAGRVTWQLVGGLCALTSFTLRYRFDTHPTFADYEVIKRIEIQSCERLFMLVPFFFAATALKLGSWLWFPQLVSHWVLIETTNAVFWVLYTVRHRWDYDTVMRARWWWQQVIFPGRMLLEAYGLIPAGTPWITYGFQAVTATVLHLSLAAHLGESLWMMALAFGFASSDSMRMWAIVLTLGSTCCTAMKIMLLQSYYEREHSLRNQANDQAWDLSSQSESAAESYGSTDYGSSATEASCQY